MRYTRNSNPRYYIDHYEQANCGSYALRVEGWYDADAFFEAEHGDMYDWIETCDWNGWSDEEMSEFYADVLVGGILEEFHDELRELHDETDELLEGEELIAFRTFAGHDYWGEYDYDFHFKVYRDGCWREKMGCHPCEECTLEDWGKYISNTIYFAHKIA